MTSEDLKSQLERSPFQPLRRHLVSGKTVEVISSGSAWMLKNSVMVLQDPRGSENTRYDILATRNIERIEQLPEGNS